MNRSPSRSSTTWLPTCKSSSPESRCPFSTRRLSKLIIYIITRSLLVILSRLQREYQPLISLFMKCLVFLQSQLQLLQKKTKPEALGAISRSILITCYTLYLQRLNNLDSILRIDIQGETLATIKGLILSPLLDP